MKINKPVLTLLFGLLLCGFAHSDNLAALGQKNLLEIRFPGLLSKYDQSFQDNLFIGHPEFDQKAIPFGVNYSRRITEYLNFGISVNHRDYHAHAETSNLSGIFETDLTNNLTAIDGFLRIGKQLHAAEPFASVGFGYLRINSVYESNSQARFIPEIAHTIIEQDFNKPNLEFRGGILFSITNKFLLGTDVSYLTGFSDINSLAWGIESAIRW